MSEVLANQPTIDGQQIAQHVATDVRSAVSDVVDAKVCCGRGGQGHPMVVHVWLFSSAYVLSTYDCPIIHTWRTKQHHQCV